MKNICSQLVEVCCPNASLAAVADRYHKIAETLGHTVQPGEPNLSHAYLKERVKEIPGGTLHFKDLPTKLLFDLDQNPKYGGKNLFETLEDANEFMYEFILDKNRDEKVRLLEEKQHWRYNRDYDQINLPDIKSNNSKGYLRFQEIQAQLLILGLLWINKNGQVMLLENKAKVVCMALNSTSKGTL